jgi:DNA-directed RNA polymerase subunit beta'
LIALWSDLTEQISQHLLAQLDPWGTISTIVKSGATKAKFQQIRQLSGIRGLMADPSGRVIPIPVLGNYRRGLSTSEVFIAARGARKGFMDRSLNTAPSGYLTRKLVEVGMEVWTTQEDCGTSEGWLITNEESRAQGLSDLRSRIVGRVLAEAVGGLPAGTLLSETQVEAFGQLASQQCGCVPLSPVRQSMASAVAATDATWRQAISSNREWPWASLQVSRLASQAHS